MTNSIQRLILILTACAMFCGNASALKMAEDKPFEVYSPNKKFILRCQPDPNQYEGAGRGTSNVYALTQSGRKLLWSVAFYDSGAIISDDGEYLVRFGPNLIHPYHRWSFANDLALIFYKHGKELKSYSVQDLIPEPSKQMEAHVLGGDWMS